MPTYVSFDSEEEALKYVERHGLKPSQYEVKKVYNVRAKRNKYWLEIKW